MLQRCVFAVISKLNLGKQNSGFPFTPATDNEKCCNIIIISGRGNIVSAHSLSLISYNDSNWQTAL